MSFWNVAKHSARSREVSSSDHLLRVLFTIQTLEGRPGGALYVRDFAAELLRLGHRPVVYSRRPGTLADELRNLTIPVINRLAQLTAEPDIIHGNSPFETMAAILHFTKSPAISVCHGWDSADAVPVRMPRVVLYIAVDETCRDRLVCHEGIPEDRVIVHLNAVDLVRFVPREPLPLKPRRALIFSSYATPDNYLPAVRKACEACDLALDLAGEGAGCLCSRPEDLLAQYDVVFAKARCALEALAVGNAVVLCDANGLGCMVDSNNWQSLRKLNFGRRTLSNPIEPELIEQEILKYNSEDAARVSETIRRSEGLEAATQSLLTIYRDAIDMFPQIRMDDCHADLRACSAFLESVAPTSNTFYLGQQVRAAERRARESERQKLAQAMPMQPLPPLERDGVSIEGVAGPGRARRGEPFTVSLNLSNGSQTILCSHAPHPMFISYHWTESEWGKIKVFEGERTSLFPPLPPGGAFQYDASVKSPREPGA